MKKILVCILICIIMFSLIGCETSYICSLDVSSFDENISIIVDGEECRSYNFSTQRMNCSTLANYSNIDFTKKESDNLTYKLYKFDVVSSSDDTCNISLELIDANRYVVDFLRVAIVIDDVVRVYKYDNILESIYHKENDPDSILHFNSKTEIFNDLSLKLTAGEPKEIVVFIWTEEAELYNRMGQRHKGWANKSYDATPIYLSLEINE